MLQGNTKKVTVIQESISNFGATIGSSYCTRTSLIGIMIAPVKLIPEQLHHIILLHIHLIYEKHLKLFVEYSIISFLTN